ncbi:MAG: DivIVA domain-containing protein [Propionibacteriales bacterium]|nr:DivIVA domain-containing protein [Propionibacteriales bacterium]
MIEPESAHLTAHAIRQATFSVRRRGLDEHEVTAYLATVADQIQLAERENAAAHKELDRLREELANRRDSPRGPQGGEEISDQAVMLFSQAQQVADILIAEAVDHARDLMATARAQQRDIMKQAHQAAEAAVRRSGAATPVSPMKGYDTPVPEIEYVRTYARVARIQLRAVLDALNEQVDKLAEVPRLSESTPPAPTPLDPALQLDSVSSHEQPREAAERR